MFIKVHVVEERKTYDFACFLSLLHRGHNLFNLRSLPVLHSFRLHKNRTFRSLLRPVSHAETLCFAGTSPSCVHCVRGFQDGWPSASSAPSGLLLPCCPFLLCCTRRPGRTATSTPVFAPSACLSGPTAPRMCRTAITCEYGNRILTFLYETLKQQSFIYI